MQTRLPTTTIEASCLTFGNHSEWCGGTGRQAFLALDRSCPSATPWRSAVVGVIGTLARHGSAAAVAAAERQSAEAPRLLYQTYFSLMCGAHSLTSILRSSGQLAQLSEADALRFGSAALLSVRAMPGKGYLARQPVETAAVVENGMCSLSFLPMTTQTR